MAEPPHTAHRTLRLGLTLRIAIALAGYLAALFAGVVLHSTYLISLCYLTMGLGGALVDLVLLAGVLRLPCRCLLLTLLVALAAGADLWLAVLVLRLLPLPIFVSHHALIQADVLHGVSHLALLATLLLLVLGLGRLHHDAGLPPRRATPVVALVGLMLMLELAFRLLLLTGVRLGGAPILVLAVALLLTAAPALLLALRLSHRLLSDLGRQRH